MYLNWISIYQAIAATCSSFLARLLPLLAITTDPTLIIHTSISISPLLDVAALEQNGRRCGKNWSLAKRGGCNLSGRKKTEIGTIAAKVTLSASGHSRPRLDVRLSLRLLEAGPDERERRRVTLHGALHLAGGMLEWYLDEYDTSKFNVSRF